MSLTEHAEHGERNGYLGHDVYAEVCTTCGALLPPYDAPARLVHQARDAAIDRLLEAGLVAQTTAD